MSALPTTNLVCGIGPSAASTSTIAPSTIDRIRSTSPPKSAWPGVSTMLTRTSFHTTEVALARMVMPRSRSRSFESITRSATRWLSRNAPDCCKSRSTSVVLPWSTWAMMAMLRSFMGLDGFWRAADGPAPAGPRKSSRREDEGDATARLALTVALAQCDCAAQYTNPGRKGRAGFASAHEELGCGARRALVLIALRVDAPNGAMAVCELGGPASCLSTAIPRRRARFRVSSTGRWESDFARRGEGSAIFSSSRYRSRPRGTDVIPDRLRSDRSGIESDLALAAAPLDSAQTFGDLASPTARQRNLRVGGPECGLAPSPTTVNPSRSSGKTRSRSLTAPSA